MAPDIKKSDRSLPALLLIALCTTLCHLLIGGNYGYFLDELYTLSCSRHLSLAFVDIPPVAPTLLALNTLLFGDSVFALHILPSIVSGCIVILVGLMAKELGGGKTAVFLAGLAAAFVPVWMAVGSLYTYDFLDQFISILLFYALVRLLRRENLKAWLAVGAIAGVGLMTKPSMIFFVAAVALALLLTKHRSMYATKWPYLGALIALLIAAPALVWQALNHFPIAEYWGAYASGKAVHASPAEFLLMQVVGMNAFLLPLWLIGLYYVLFHPEGKRFRLFGVLYAVLFAVFLASGAKMYMLIPAYAVLLAAGAIRLEKIGRKGLRTAAVAGYAALIALTGIVQAPNFMPILPVEKLVQYYDTVGGLFGAKSIRLDANAPVSLPQYFYDKMEWDVLVRDVASVYHELSEQERADTAIVSQNYGRAGAIDQLGGAYGLPKAMCGQLNCYFFSLNDLEKKTWIMIGETQEGLKQYFSDVKLAKISHTRYRQPIELPIFICRQPKFTPEEARQGLKKFS